MKISEYGSVKSTTAARRRASASGASSSFSDILSLASTDGVEQTGQLSDISATAPTEGVLSVQEVSADSARRQKLKQQGHNMLDVLENLRMRLLAGTIPPHLMEDLSHQLALKKEQVDDPALISIIEEIELRAAVELAKLERARNAV